jgi:hypothetical protein
MLNILDWQSFNEGYNKPRAGGKRRWSVKYKKKIDCSNARGFSQKQYCKRKRRGGHYKTESVNNDSIRQTLNDIFLEVSDNTNWYFNVEGDNTSNFYEIYISHGDEQPYHNAWRREEGDGECGYKERKISKELIDCIKRSIDFMESEDFSYNLILCMEYSSDPGEDYVEKIEVDDLNPGESVSENESIRIKFTK